MIRTFSNKALDALWESGNERKLPSQCVLKIKILLSILDASNNMKDLEIFSKKYRIHTLKKPPYEGFLSFDVTGNYRIIGRLDNGDWYDIDFLDTH